MRCRVLPRKDFTSGPTLVHLEDCMALAVASCFPFPFPLPSILSSLRKMPSAFLSTKSMSWLKALLSSSRKEIWVVSSSSSP